MATLSSTTQASYAQLADWLLARCSAAAGRTAVIGVNGAQGSGKSTCSHWLRSYLKQQHGLRVAVVSLDDFYLTRAERQQLARTQHPLLQTRGVPGTHDVGLGSERTQSLCAVPAGECVRLPTFDKAIDDRRSAEHDVVVEGPLDLVLFEGWCVGVPAQSPEALRIPVNTFESREDADGHWRGYVNGQLAGPYAAWFSQLDALIHLAVPGWDSVYQWRSQQEEETAAQNPGGAGIMDATALRRFMAHYERLTRHALSVLPDKADAVLKLDLAHSVRIETLR